MNTTKITILETWTESESGWGNRPDGGSLHLTKDDYEKFVKMHWESEKKRNPSGNTPYEYTRQDQNPKAVYVSDKLYNLLLKEKKKHGIWLFQSEMEKYFDKNEIVFIV